MATVTNTITLPGGGTPTHCAVEIELIASSTGLPAAGWITATDVTILARYRPTVTDGEWTADLTPNADIDPSGTVYKVTEYADKTRVVNYIDVGSGGGSVHDLLTSGPSGLVFDSVTNHAADTTTHGATGAVVGTTNTQTLTNKTLDAAILTADPDDTTIKRVFLGPYTYDVANLDLGAVELIGCGPAQTVIRCTSAASDVLRVSTSSNGGGVRDLSIVGGATSGSTTQHGIRSVDAGGPDDFHVSNVWFSGLNIGVKAYQSERWTVTGCRFTDIKGSSPGGGYGVLLGRSNNCKITDNVFIGDRDNQHGRHAIYVTIVSSNNVIHGNSISEYRESAIQSNTTAIDEPPCAGNVYSSNTIVDCGYTTAVDQSAINLVGRQANNLIVGNIVRDVDYFGMRIGPSANAGSPGDETSGSWCYRNTIAANVIDGCYGAGIELQCSTDSSVLANSIFDAGGSGTVAGIVLRGSGNSGTGAEDGAVISGNRIDASSIRASIEVSNSTVVPTNFSIFGNYLVTGTVGTAIRDLTYGQVWDSLNVIDGAQAKVSSTLPTAAAGYRGQQWVKQADGVEDKVCVCVRTTAGGYKWINVTDGSTVT